MQEADQHRIIISGKYWGIRHVLISFAGGKLLRSLAVRLLHKTAQGFLVSFKILSITIIRNLCLRRHGLLSILDWRAGGMGDVSAPETRVLLHP
jgi:hypothetical protein